MLFSVMTRVKIITGRGTENKEKFGRAAYDWEIHNGSENESPKPGEAPKNGEDSEKG